MKHKLLLTLNKLRIPLWGRLWLLCALILSSASVASALGADWREEDTRDITTPRELLPSSLAQRVSLSSRVTTRTVVYSEPELVRGFGPPSTNPQEDDIWHDVPEATIQVWGKQERLIVPERYRTVGLNPKLLHAYLAMTLLEQSTAIQSAEVIITLPLPDGTLGRFSIVESPIMAPELGAIFPKIRTYAGHGIDDPAARVRFDWTPAGFHAMILSSDGTIYIDPYNPRDIIHYVSYFRRDYGNFLERSFEEDGSTSTDPWTEDLDFQRMSGGDTSSAPTLHTYRLALAAAGEYTQFHGGTVTETMAAMVTTLNRVNGIFEREVSVRMILVAGNDQLIYTDLDTDPYTGWDPSAMMFENQTNIDTVIGNENYDIGHVFGVGGGGVSEVGNVCGLGLLSGKARGVSMLFVPGDPFDVGIVAHEIGHQFGAHHTFNAAGAANCTSTGRSVPTAYEPGSGSTIMSYAATNCSTQNLQSMSDDYFHTVSFDEIIATVTNTIGVGCGTHTATGNSTPMVEAGSDYTIPKQTPFILDGSATDLNDDTLIYTWEEFDLGTAWTDVFTLPNTDSDGNARPIFRSYEPVLTSSRTFPKLDSILDASHSNDGESLSTTSRAMQFRLTARDNKGGVAHDSMTVTVHAGAGPFAVTTPNTAVTWNLSTSEAITWSVANTNLAPVSCANVNILLSTDGGHTFPTALATNTPNDGAEMLTVPSNKGTSTGRVKVECADNIFFDISNSDFVIDAPNVFISKIATLANTSVQNGAPVTYTIVVANSGTRVANNINVTDTLPSGVTGPNLDTVIPTLTVGQSVTFTIVATVASNLGTIINIAYYNYIHGSGQDSATFTIVSEIYLPIILKNSESAL